MNRRAEFACRGPWRAVALAAVLLTLRLRRLSGRNVAISLREMGSEIITRSVMSTLLLVAAVGAEALGQYWQNGDVVTYTESERGGTPSGNNPAMILATNFVPVI